MYIHVQYVLYIVDTSSDKVMLCYVIGLGCVCGYVNINKRIQPPVPTPVHSPG